MINGLYYLSAILSALFRRTLLAPLSSSSKRAIAAPITYTSNVSVSDQSLQLENTVTTHLKGCNKHRHTHTAQPYKAGQAWLAGDPVG